MRITAQTATDGQWWVVTGLKVAGASEIASRIAAVTHQRAVEQRRRGEITTREVPAV